MVKQFIACCAVIIAGFQAQAQTLRIRCNSVENFQVVAVGVNAAGKHTSGRIYNLSDDWKIVSLYDMKFGYDEYNNAEMVHEPNDSTWKWEKLLIYKDGSNTYDSLDITKPARKLSLNNCDLKAKIKVGYDRRYVVTDVILNDN